jgi:anthranilate synthase component II
VKVLLVDNYDSFTHNIISTLQTIGQSDITIVKNDAIDFEAVHNYNGIIISPGPKTPQESGQIIELIKIFAPTIPILGICLGHQAIAEAFGGCIYNMPMPKHGCKIKLQIIQDHPIYKNLIQPVEVGLYHSWAVDEAKLSKDLVISAIQDNGVIMSMYHKVYPIIGLQYHPESFMTTNGPQIFKNWLALL